MQIPDTQGLCIPCQYAPGEASSEGCPGELAPKEPGYDNEAIHRASKGPQGRRSLLGERLERLIPEVRDRQGRLKHSNPSMVILWF